MINLVRPIEASSGLNDERNTRDNAQHKLRIAIKKKQEREIDFISRIKNMNLEDNEFENLIINMYSLKLVCAHVRNYNEIYYLVKWGNTHLLEIVGHDDGSITILKKEGNIPSHFQTKELILQDMIFAIYLTLKFKEEKNGSE